MQNKLDKRVTKLVTPTQLTWDFDGLKLKLIISYESSITSNKKKSKY